MSTSLAPIALFVYNRPEHTRKTLDHLQQNLLVSDSELFIFCDGPKENDTDDHKNRIREVRRIAGSVTWAKKVHLVNRENNIGLAKSIVGGITQLTREFGKVIVLEDDLLTSPGFLKFTNQALELYENETRLYHISAYMYPQIHHPFRASLPETFAMRVMACWGWATWKRAWNHYQDSSENLFNQLQAPGLMNRLNLDGASRSFERQLILNMENKMHTWAIKWYASILLQNGLCLFPKNSLVKNIGNDGSGINSGYTRIYEKQKTASAIAVRPVSLIENPVALRRTQWFYQFLEKKKSIADKVLEKLNLIC